VIGDVRVMGSVGGGGELRLLRVLFSRVSEVELYYVISMGTVW
jgi:hypothetical protein